MSEESEVSEAPDEPGMIEKAKSALGLGDDAATDPADPDPAEDEPVEEAAAPPSRKEVAKANASRNVGAKNKRKYG